jgi:hypothetical protein
MAVADAMVKRVLSADPDPWIVKPAKALVEHEIHRLPGTEGGRWVGLLTMLDRVRLIADGRERSLLTARHLLHALHDALDITLGATREGTPLPFATRFQDAELMARIAHDPSQTATRILSGDLDLLLERSQIPAQLAPECL